MIRNMIAVILSAVILFSFAACGTDNGNNTTNDTNNGNNMTDNTDNGMNTRGITNDINEGYDNVRNTTDNIVDDINMR